MLIAQADPLQWWATIIQYNALVGIVVFTGTATIWIGRRFFARDGIFTRWTEQNTQHTAQMCGMQKEILLLEEKQAHLTEAIGADIDRIATVLESSGIVCRQGLKTKQ